MADKAFDLDEQAGVFNTKKYVITISKTNTIVPSVRLVSECIKMSLRAIFNLKSTINQYL